VSGQREPIGVIGTGYVGLVTAAGFAALGSDVYCVDIDAEKVRGLREARLPDRDLAPAQAVDLGLVDVDAVDVRAELREARGGDEPHVAGADDADRFAVHGSGAG